MAAPALSPAGLRVDRVQKNAILSVANLEIARGGRPLFDGLAFALAPTQLAVVTGANGSGKTTLLRTLAGLQVPTAGAILVNGIPVRQIARDLVTPIAFQGHLEGLNQDLTVAENMHFYRRLWGGDLPIAALAQELRLDEYLERKVRHLSAGQKRRTALGCLRLRPATLWLLDEPLTNLDQLGVDLVTAWLQAHLSSGGVAVVATHQAERLALRAHFAVEL